MNSLALYKERPSEWGEKDDAPVTNARLLAILDLSGSMSTMDAGEEGTRRRVDVLKDALDDLVASFPNQVAAMGFHVVKSDDAPQGWAQLILEENKPSGLKAIIEVPGETSQSHHSG